MKKFSLILAFFVSFAFAKFTCENGKLSLKEGSKVYPASYEFSSDSSRVKIHFIGLDENRMLMPLTEEEGKEEHKILENCLEWKIQLQKMERHSKSQKPKKPKK